jgi:hypothetical protein
MARINRLFHWRKRTLLTILSVAIVGLIIASVLRSIFIYYTVRNSFCTPNDEIYQTIQSNLSIWVESDFRPNETTSSSHLNLSTPNGERYTAIGMEPDRFFVVTEYDYPHSYLGLRGYVYSPSDIGQIYTEYKFISLGENLFCYESKL